MFQSVAFDRRRPSRSLADLVTRYGGLHDVEEVEAMHARCSDESLYHRFHAPLPRVSERIVRQLLMPVAGWSLVAVRSGRVVGLACAAPLSSGDLEVGLLVEDAHQAQGIGARMLHEVAFDAAGRGYTDLHCLTRPDNTRVLATVRNAGLVGRVTWWDGLLQIQVPLTRLAGGVRKPA